MKRDLTSGSVLAAIVSFSAPYLLTCFLQAFYGAADLFVVGMFFGADVITSVAIGSQVMHMITVMIVGLAMGTTVLVARAVGAKDNKLAAKAIGNTATVFAVASLLIMAVLLFCVEPIVSAMQTPTEAVSGTSDYLFACFIGIPLITAYNVVAAVFRGLGDTKSPLLFVAIACVLNVALDFALVGGAGLGAIGAAIATVVAQAVSVAVSVVYMRYRKVLPPLHQHDFRPQKSLVSGILKIGVPVSLQDGLIQIAFLAITVFANMRGLSDAAAVGIVEKLISLFFLVPSSMLAAVSALAAQNMGANQHDRARSTLKCATAISVIYGVCLALIMQVASPAVIGLFTTDEQVVRLGCQYMSSYVSDTPIAGIHFCFSGFFCAYGYSSISFAHNCASAFLFRIPLSYYAAISFPDTLFPMGLAAPAGSLFSVAICLIAYFWMQKRLSQGKL